MNRFRPGAARLSKGWGQASGSEATSRLVLQQIERKRRAYLLYYRSQPLPKQLLVDLTVSSFRMDHLRISEREVGEAFGCGAEGRAFRIRPILRIRNHAAILIHMDRMVRRGQELRAETAVRWYTSISCGLSTAQVEASQLERLEACLRRMNVPRLRLRAAVAEIAGVHVELLRDPVFPGFNGIVARLLLQYHLGRCGLPPVVFDAERDRGGMAEQETLVPRLMRLIAESCRGLVGKVNPKEEGERRYGGT
ncbi:MAG: hypothetical protein ACM359_15235 [Bacillota bacterium]